jgi:general secretion pathway protein J
VSETPDEAGFTLIEMIVALGLLALISMAGLALVETVLSAQRRTDGRMERLATIERALFLIDADFTQATDGPRFADNAVLIRRNGRDGPVLVGYALVGGALVRLYNMAPHALLPGVLAAHWRFHRGGTWEPFPPKSDDPLQDDAVELTLQLAPGDGAPGGTLRRVIPLPAKP